MKRFLSILLCTVIVILMIPAPVHAAPVVSYRLLDGTVYMGGIFDAAVHVSEGAERATYQWQVDVSMGDGSWQNLDDSKTSVGYHGTHTDHFQFVTLPQDSSYEVGTGWETIPFRCKVTIDGKNYYTTPFVISIYPYSSLKGSFASCNYGIMTRNYNGVTFRGEVNGVSYGTAIAGEQLFLRFSCRQPSYDSMHYRSELRFIPEIWVTENGKTTRFTSDSHECQCYYTPTTLGDNSVTVEYKVRMMLGLNDMGIFESEKMVISTVSSYPCGIGEAKYDCSVLKEMYTQSEKLCPVPKGAQVDLLENIGGSWWKVSYNNTVGYIPSSGLTVLERISSVSVIIPEPVIGQSASFAPELGSSTYGLYDIEPVTWFDKTDNRSLQPGDKFQYGHRYSLSVWLKAGEDFLFEVYDGDPWLQGTLNGFSLKPITAYEQDPSEVVEMYYDFGTCMNPFVDVSSNAFYYQSVLWAYYNGITSGKDASHFEPSAACTRAQVVTFLWRAAGQPVPKNADNPFPDVPEGKYYTNAVLWAVENGITAGYKDGTFGPNKTCTRDQIVTFLWRYAGKPDPTSDYNPFPDVPEGKFYTKAVLWAVENGITSGYKNGTFGPSKTCTRDQIVTFLYRYMTNK